MPDDVRQNVRLGSWDEGSGAQEPPGSGKSEIDWFRVGAACAVLLFALGIYGWLWFKGTPTYSLMQLRKAIAARDADAAMMYIDMDSVVDGLLRQAMAKNPQAASPQPHDMKDTKAVMQDMGQILAQGMMAMFTPMIKEGLRTGVRQSIASGDDNSVLRKDLLAEGKAKPSVSRRGKDARVTLGDGKTVLVMRKAPEGYWRIVGVEGAEAMFKDVLPAMRQGQDAPQGTLHGARQGT